MPEFLTKYKIIFREHSYTMAIDINQLRAARFGTQRVLATNINEAKRLGVKTAFLCHSHNDRDLVLGVQLKLQEIGMQLYIDWQDSAMPSSPNRETALRIKEKIVQTDFFLYLATENSSSSRWCPWEIGYADGKKSIDKIITIPVKDRGHEYGAEYLQLYRRLDVDSMGKAGIWSPGRATYWPSESL